MAKKMTIMIISAIIFFASSITSYADDNGFFTPFQTSDWIGLGLTGVMDFLDLDSSYSAIEHSLSVYHRENYTTTSSYSYQSACPPGYTGCFVQVTNTYHHSYPKPPGEINPFFPMIFGTHYPTPLDYAAFGALELGTQALVAWALPEKWRTGAWGLYIGIGATDTLWNAAGGGVTFRF